MRQRRDCKDQLQGEFETRTESSNAVLPPVLRPHAGIGGIGGNGRGAHNPHCFDPQAVIN
jgi:hypothetical protein